jgi:glycosyltransferase involved in cell wall biosynthesis
LAEAIEMIIGIDGREMEGKPTGVGVYLRNLLKKLSVPGGAHLQIYFKTEIPDLTGIDAEPVLLKSTEGNLLWQQKNLSNHLRQSAAQLFFSPSNSVPWFFDGINVMTIHDLSYFRYPEWFSLKERASKRLNTYISLRNADRIYVVSNYVGKEIQEQFGVPSSRILITSNGVTRKETDPRHRQALRKTYGHEKDKIVLYVGSIFNRRHVPELIESMLHLEPSVKLIVIGENRTYPEQDLRGLLGQLNLEPRVKLLDYVSDQLLQDYYEMADLFVYLSDYEGFGIPPLEAMSFGIPVVLSLTPAMNEIFQGAAHFVKGTSPKEVSNAIEHCLEDSLERNQLQRNGKKLADHYTWEEAARVVSSDWEQLIAARG